MKNKTTIVIVAQVIIIIILIWIIVLLGNKNITGIQSDEDEADEDDESLLEELDLFFFFLDSLIKNSRGALTLFLSFFCGVAPKRDLLTSAAAFAAIDAASASFSFCALSARRS